MFTLEFLFLTTGGHVVALSGVVNHAVHFLGGIVELSRRYVKTFQMVSYISIKIITLSIRDLFVFGGIVCESANAEYIRRTLVFPPFWMESGF